MQRKALLFGITVIILTLGVMGAAFATGMDFTNVGALSSGKSELTQINTDHVGFLSSEDGYGIDRVAISFDRDLTIGSTIWIKIDDEVYGWKVLDIFLSADDEIIIELNEVLDICEIHSSKNVKVAVAER